MIGLLLGGCGGSDGLSSRNIVCTTNDDCGSDATCLASECIADGGLGEQQGCTNNRQCATGLVCKGLVCQSGCTDFYRLAECPSDSFCRPTTDYASGDCTRSQCDPVTTTFCSAGVACVALSDTIGACVPYCQYGYVGEAYQDTCHDAAGIDFACQPLGLTEVPVCLPEGQSEAGTPGCDPVRDPCAVGLACVDVVCRALCRSGQADPCSPGERCVPLVKRTDVSYCRAD